MLCIDFMIGGIRCRFVDVHEPAQPSLNSSFYRDVAFHFLFPGATILADLTVNFTGSGMSAIPVMSGPYNTRVN